MSFHPSGNFVLEVLTFTQAKHVRERRNGQLLGPQSRRRGARVVSPCPSTDPPTHLGHVFRPPHTSNTIPFGRIRRFVRLHVLRRSETKPSPSASSTSKLTRSKTSRAIRSKPSGLTRSKTRGDRWGVPPFVRGLRWGGGVQGRDRRDPLGAGEVQPSVGWGVDPRNETNGPG